MDRQLDERLVNAFERIAAALENIAGVMYDKEHPPTVQWQPPVGTIPTFPPLPTLPYQYPPNTTPLEGPYKIGDPPGWPTNPTVICSGGTVSAMTQADGMGDDSGFRGD
jgi:hypothetical protein